MARDRSPIPFDTVVQILRTTTNPMTAKQVAFQARLLVPGPTQADERDIQHVTRCIAKLAEEMRVVVMHTVKADRRGGRPARAWGWTGVL